ncbi:VOC family protein [Cyanobium sp. Aljojuca 7D2]|uniref:VOC family protein n=1 Tax=Cyanobium sp. Aljojuca 7D2 TaxID=2823698 RepID=UPI0020CCED2A|nr:VOC family protein [Cyanobium sp. Aljojuca 7D2]MCP9890661.1 VOC family protein [Cyanobium sp. Aljojuca 7D2]
MPLPHLLQIGFTTANADATADFFETSLGFRRGESLLVEAGPYAQLVGLPGSRLKLVRLHLGDETLELTEVLSLGEGLRPGRPIPADSRSCDLWFQHICIVVSDLNAASAPARRTIANGSLVGVSTAPQTLPAWNTAAAGIQAFKFRDPEGHNLELLQFPPDKGEARWHAPPPASAPFLGIDHSALSVADTPRSCHFYDELLGLKLGGDGMNSGPTQDRLDGLTDTRVRITSHRCPKGAGVECLNYQPPNSGRPRPADQGTQDQAHWQIRLRVADLDRIATAAEAFGGQPLHGGVIELGDQGALVGSERALQLADPDGHQLQLVQG